MIQGVFGSNWSSLWGVLKAHTSLEGGFHLQWIVNSKSVVTNQRVQWCTSFYWECSFWRDIVTSYLVENSFFMPFLWEVSAVGRRPLFPLSAIVAMKTALHTLFGAVILECCSLTVFVAFYEMGCTILVAVIRIGQRNAKISEILGEVQALITTLFQKRLFTNAVLFKLLLDAINHNVTSGHRIYLHELDLGWVCMLLAVLDTAQLDVLKVNAGIFKLFQKSIRYYMQIYLLMIWETRKLARYAGLDNRHHW